jgi:hypothetical protein
MVNWLICAAWVRVGLSVCRLMFPIGIRLRSVPWLRDA